MADGTLDLIDLDQNKTGYRQFLCCYVFRGEGMTLLVDPGPASTIPLLTSSLDELEVKEVDLILLTHIHLDHGGGAAQLLEKYPNAKIYCHEIGVKHMVDPTTLWAGTQKVLGEVAKLYGEPSPIPEASMASKEEVESRGIQIIPTPGHASHHVSFLFDELLFVGEAFGTRVDTKSGQPYLRPATPPKFILEDALESLDRILALPEEPKYVAFAHYGVADATFTWCKFARKQLVIWVEALRAICAESEDNLEQRFFDYLMNVDPLYGRGRFDELDKDIQHRERNFLANTMAGMLGYIKAS